MGICLQIKLKGKICQYTFLQNILMLQYSQNDVNIPKINTEVEKAVKT